MRVVAFASCALFLLSFAGAASAQTGFDVTLTDPHPLSWLPVGGETVYVGQAFEVTCDSPFSEGQDATLRLLFSPHDYLTFEAPEALEVPLGSCESGAVYQDVVHYGVRLAADTPADEMIYYRIGAQLVWGGPVGGFDSAEPVAGKLSAGYAGVLWGSLENSTVRGSPGDVVPIRLSLRHTANGDTGYELDIPEAGSNGSQVLLQRSGTLPAARLYSPALGATLEGQVVVGSSCEARSEVIPIHLSGHWMSNHHVRTNNATLELLVQNTGGDCPVAVQGDAATIGATSKVGLGMVAAGLLVFAVVLLRRYR